MGGRTFKPLDEVKQERGAVNSILEHADKIASQVAALTEIRQLCEEMSYSAVSDKVLRILTKHGVR